MSDSVVERGRDGDLIPVPEVTGPQCICDGSGWAGTVQIDGRDVVKVCVACKTHLAGRVASVAQRVVGAMPRPRPARRVAFGH